MPVILRGDVRRLFEMYAQFFELLLTSLISFFHRLIFEFSEFHLKLSFSAD